MGLVYWTEARKLGYKCHGEMLQENGTFIKKVHRQLPVLTLLHAVIQLHACALHDHCSWVDGMPHPQFPGRERQEWNSSLLVAANPVQ